MPVQRLSPGVYRDQRTGKLIKAATEAQALQMSQGGGKPQPGAGQQAGGQGGGGQNLTPAQRQTRKGTAFGTSNVAGTTQTTVNPNTGAAYTEETLSPGQQAVFEAGEQLSTQGLEGATDYLGKSDLTTPFDPKAPDRTVPTDLEASREQAYQTALKYLSRDTDAAYARDKEQLAQTLANQGIEYNADPNSRYQRELGDMERKYRDIRESAQDRARLASGEELERSFGIDEQRIANIIDQSLKTREGQRADVTTLSNLGPGFQPPSAVSTTTPATTAELGLATQEAKRRKKEGRANRRIARQELGLKRQALARSGGGGGGEQVFE